MRAQVLASVAGSEILQELIREAASGSNSQASIALTEEQLYVGAMSSAMARFTIVRRGQNPVWSSAEIAQLILEEGPHGLHSCREVLATISAHPSFADFGFTNILRNSGSCSPNLGQLHKVEQAIADYCVGGGILAIGIKKNRPFKDVLFELGRKACPLNGQKVSATFW